MPGKYQSDLKHSLGLTRKTHVAFYIRISPPHSPVLEMRLFFSVTQILFILLLFYHIGLYFKALQNLHKKY